MLDYYVSFEDCLKEKIEWEMSGWIRVVEEFLQLIALARLVSAAGAGAGAGGSEARNEGEVQVTGPEAPRTAAVARRRRHRAPCQSVMG